MVNNTPESKFDETVKETLSGYEAPYDASDWSRMESMLDAAPKSNPVKWSHIITIAAGIIVIGGGYGLYKTFNGPKKVETETIATPPINTNIKESPKPKPAAPVPVPSVTNTTNITSPEKEPAINNTITNEPAASSPVTDKKEERIVVKTEKTKTKKPNNEPVSEPHEKIIIMGNEPVFGDMLDSSKGIVGETKEKEEVKKAAKAKKETTIGWDRIMTPHMNIDSMRKVREQRDSLNNNK